MDMVAQFLKLVDAYARATKLAESTISARIFNDGKRIGRLRDRSGDVGILKIGTAIEWFAGNWPDGTSWPPGVPRPDLRRSARRAS